MTDRWYREAVIYCVQVDLFRDSNGDGCGDLRGLISRLDYLSHLGITCLWLNPIHPSPLRDGGYDVADFYGVHPRLGSLGDFADLTLQAAQRGIRIVLDLVVNHTSDQHPWFQSARSSPDSPYRDWYVWCDTEPADRRQGIVFPGEQTETWTYDETAKAWYFHRFYDFQPDLNWANPAVRDEIGKVMGFWQQLGASGFRVDAAPFVLEQVTPDVDPAPKDFTILDRWRQDLQWRTADAVLLCEANVAATDVNKYTGTSVDGPNDRTHMMFSFLLNARLWLALAREEAETLVESLTDLPRLQPQAQWATFLRNHDELDLSRLTDDQREDVFRVFAPRADMRLYGRGIRRRLAPMLNGDRRHIELAYALQFAMPGTPVLRYGEEIGMGENLALAGPGRDPHPDAMVRHRQRRILHRPQRGVGRAGQPDRAVRGPAGECAGAATRPGLAVAVVPAADRGGAGMPGDRHRRLPGGGRPGAAVGVDPPLRHPAGSGAAAAQPGRRPGDRGRRQGPGRPGPALGGVRRQRLPATHPRR